MQEKQCNKCKQYLDLIRFSKSKHVDGTYGYRNTCSKCRNKQQNNKRKGTINNWVNNTYRNSKKRSVLKQLEHNLTKEWIVANLPKTCPVLNIEISFTGNIYNSPSIDRFNNNKGYTTDNCKIISHRANTLKNNATVAELEAIVRYMKGNEG